MLLLKIHICTRPQWRLINTHTHTHKHWMIKSWDILFLIRCSFLYFICCNNIKNLTNKIWNAAVKTSYIHTTIMKINKHTHTHTHTHTNTEWLKVELFVFCMYRENNKDWEKNELQFIFLTKCFEVYYLLMTTNMHKNFSCHCLEFIFFHL